jgi:pimeloyl-ACP methyl ester carboxylesterase
MIDNKGRNAGGGMPTESHVDVRGSKLHVRRDGRGEPLLFLHGAQGLTGWEPFLAALAQRFDVIAPDHSGFGRSDIVEGVDDVGDLSLFYFDALKALGLPRAHVVGHCLGGWVGLEMAIRNAAALRTLTLLASAGLRLDGVPRADMFICPQDELAQLLFAGNNADAWTQAWHQSPEWEEIYDRNRAAAARFTWQPRLCNPKLARWLHRIDVPTHVVWGENDKVIPPAYGAALKDRIDGATMTLIPACGHLPHVEHPVRIAETVTQFIQRAAS